MKLILILIVGLGVLGGALVLNWVAAKLGLMSWYTFLGAPGSARVIDYVWLFLGYPFFLGVVAAFCVRWIL